MSQIPLFDSDDKIGVNATQEPSAGQSYRRFILHSELPESSAQKLLKSFLKQLRKLDPGATANLENVMSVGPWVDMPFLCVDVETTGLDRTTNRVIEIAWVLFRNQEVILENSHLCKIETPLPSEITNLTGITEDMLRDQKPFSAHVPELFEALSQCAFVVAYNANFDRLFIEAELARVDLPLPELHWIDPCVFVRQIDKFQKGKRLVDATRRWGVELSDAHRAMADAKATGLLLYKLASHLEAPSLPELIVLQKKWQKEQDDNYKAYAARKKSF